MRAQSHHQQMLETLYELFTMNDIGIRAWVVLPNHYHLLAHVPDFDVLGSIFRRVHGPTSRKWNLEDATPGRKVWYRYTDRAIRSERHYHTTLNYIHYNPVKHGWARSPYDWMESSVHWYLEHFGRQWLRDVWASYHVRDYGRGWDDVGSTDER
jgi:putative transposase